MKTLTGFRLLIVEDNSDLRELLASEFSMCGGEVETAANGTTALEMIKKIKYDFIVSDMRMPQGDGRFLAAEVLKLKESRPPFFLYTGHNEISAQEAVTLGILQIFNKPFQSSEMVDSILSHLKKKDSA